MKRIFKNHSRRETNRTVARFTHDGEAYTIHERANLTSSGDWFTRRFICRVSDGGHRGEASNVREARRVLNERGGQ